MRRRVVPISTRHCVKKEFDTMYIFFTWGVVIVAALLNGKGVGVYYQI
jgi:hypothetical protein